MNLDYNIIFLQFSVSNGVHDLYNHLTLIVHNPENANFAEYMIYTGKLLSLRVYLISIGNNITQSTLCNMAKK